MNIFNELRNLYLEKEKNNLVIFVGAGISQFYSNTENDKPFPSWDGLIEKLVIDDFKENFCIDYLKTAQIFEDTYSRKKLLETVKELFPKNYDCSDLHKLIFEVEPAHIITTNYDNLLEKAMEQKNYDGKYHIVNEDNSIPLSKSKQNLLVKAHGDFDKNNIVLSENDYNDYDKNFPLILSFMRFIFSKYKVLFIGFSLSDPNFNKILYWVKSVLKENSIKHTLISHNNISKSEKIHFDKKNVSVITQNEIISEIVDKDNYLKSALSFIKNGFPKEKFSKKQRLDILLNNISELKNLKYLLPEIVQKTLISENLKFFYESLADIKNKNDREKVFPYIANIFQSDFYIGKKDMLNLYYLIKDEKSILDTNILNEIFSLFLSTNIIYIGDIKVFDASILIAIDDKELNQLSTYSFDKNGIFIESDLSLLKGCLSYDFFTFSTDDYYIDYLLGDKNNAYNKCKELGFDKNNDIEKYLYYFRLQYLFNGRKILNYEDLDEDSFNVYDNIFNIMTKHKQKILSSIHRLDFVKNFDDYITDTIIGYENHLKKMEGLPFHSSIDSNDSFHYKNSFYINYSRFLKFILLNKFPIIEDYGVQNVIHRANVFYFENFTNENTKISNWNLIGFLLDSNESKIEDMITRKHNKSFNTTTIIDFEHSYVEDLFISNISIDLEKSFLKIVNLFYLISLSAKKEENFVFILDLYNKLIRHNTKNIEYFTKALNISYINYSTHNEFSQLTKSKLKDIMNFYIEYKLTSLSSGHRDKTINDNAFSNFILNDFNINYTDKSEVILMLLDKEEIELSCQNLTSFIYLLKMMGYEINDITKNIIIPIKKVFEEESFYKEFNHPSNKCPNQVEHSVIKVYKLFLLDIGVKKIEEHYIDILLKESGSLKDNAMECIIYLIDEGIISKEFYSIIREEDIVQKFSSSLNHMFKKELITPFDKWLDKQRNLLVEFLLKTKNVNLITNALEQLDDEKNSYNFIKIFICIINQPKVINNHKDDLIEILNYFDNTKFKNMLLPTKYLLLNHVGLDDKELRNILLNIFKDGEDGI